MFAVRCRAWNHPWKTWQSTGRYSTAAKSLTPVPVLENGSIALFREQAFQAKVPALVPRGLFSSLPAIKKWFVGSDDGFGNSSLNEPYLSSYGRAIVPIEITQDGQFNRVEQSLQFFLNASASSELPARVYLAQASLADLPAEMRHDIPTPDMVLEAGKGDVYDSSIWLGRAPTYTPLHRDPNPNLFVQLSGAKRVRLFNPQLGAYCFHQVQASIGANASATMRGAEMMEGAERLALEQAVWGDDHDDAPWRSQGLECEVGPGDGLFIPQGWWHSIKGTGNGIIGSVNWWFR